MIPTPDYGEANGFGNIEPLPSERVEVFGQPVDNRPAVFRAVKAIRIDDLSLPRVDLIKIDVEAELDVLEGARDTIGRCRPYLLVDYLKSGAPPPCHPYLQVEYFRSGTGSLSTFFGAIDYQWWLTAGDRMLAVPQGDPITARIRSR
jgi:hypothetical protein